MYGHPDVQAPVVVGINREYPFLDMVMRTGAANEANSLHTSYWYAVAGVEPSHHGKERSGRAQKDKRERKRACGHWFMIQRYQTIEGREFDWFFRCHDMGGSKQ
jgi:hypothetical protein